MKIVLNLEKSAFENASYYFESAKKIRSKIISAEEAGKKMKNIEKKQKEKKTEQGIKKVITREWYEKFFWTLTSKGKLCIGGKNADDNEEIVKKYFENNDLFFHADVIGASVVILKNGKEADEQELLEAAQFAICYSKSWGLGFQRANAYAVEKEYISKTNQGTVAPKGSFFILGERKWFRNIILSLRIGIYENKIIAIPAVSKIKLEQEIEIKPGNLKREVIAKSIAKQFGISSEDALALLPVGRFFQKRID